MKNIFAISSIIFFAFILIGCNKKSKDEYTGFYYPNYENLDSFKEVGKFKTLEECQKTVSSFRDNSTKPDMTDGECGKNCRYDTNLQLNICKETYENIY